MDPTFVCPPHAIQNPELSEDFSWSFSVTYIGAQRGAPFVNLFFGCLVINYLHYFNKNNFVIQYIM